LTRHPGPRMFIQANLAFGAVPVGQTGELTARVWNTGSGNPLTIQGVDVPAGLGDFSLDPGVTLSPVAPGKSLNLPIRFQATAGEKTGALVVRSDDFFTPNLQLHVSGSGVAPGGPARLGLRPRNLYFGPTTISKPRKLTVRALNVGQSDLNLKGLKRVEGDDAFTDPVGPSLPQTIGLKEDKDFDIDFKPGPAFSVVASTGDFAAIYDTQSNDPRPLVRFTATGKRIGGRYPLLDVILLFTAIGTGPGILGLITFFSEDESE